MLVAAVLGVGGAIAVRKLQAGRAEQDLWREATDPVG
nr:DLW-39 family protein [Motilibacter deserti]